MADYLMLVTDRLLNVVGDPIVGWTDLDITLHFNEPDSAMMTVPGEPWIKDMLKPPGRRVVCIRNREILMAGPVEKKLAEQSDDGENAGDGRFTVNWADDSALIAARQVYPDPAVPFGAGQPSTGWTYTGNAEQALRALVDLNAGPGALPARRVPKLVLGDLAGVGSNITIAATWMQPFGDLARAIAETGGRLGFRTRQVGDQILFEVYAPPNKAHTVRFGFALGNMRYRSVEENAPTCTTALVGDRGGTSSEGTVTGAAGVERTNTADEDAWGRFEQFVSQSGDADPQVIADYGDRQLADGAATTRVAANVSDTPDQQFWSHYRIGDIVSLEKALGEETSEIVRTVHIQATGAAGEYVSPTVGSQEAVTDPRWLAKMKELDERLGRVERNVKPT